MTGVEIHAVGPDRAEELLAAVRPAFAARPPLDPPAATLTETAESMATLLGPRGGLLATLDGRAVGGLVLDPVGTTMYLRRFGVLPDVQGHGIAARLIEAAVAASEGFDDLTVVARLELPETVAFWERRGFREVRRNEPNVELRRPLNTFLFDVPDADSMRTLGRALADQLRAGDLVVLTGELGAGKTTLTQGIGEGLGVRGDVTSPTFVIARVHPSLADGPALVHVDAYRLGGIDELDDLDLDASLDDSVTVVEWGEGIAEGLAESRLELRIIRALAHVGDAPGLDPRRVLMMPVGPRWYELEVPDTQRPPLAEKPDETLLVDFWPCAERDLHDLDREVPLTMSMLVPEHEDRVLLVHNTRTAEWELPLARLAPDASPRAAVVEQYRRATGGEPGQVDFCGVATIQYGHERVIKRVAIYRAVVPGPDGLRPGADVDGLAWWDPVEDHAGLSAIDAHVVRVLRSV
ncbi:tRNA (adenosine(37)-N6)-threonylcarbamoyltransferase complex ATPase subunit type 1 TsaE [Nocardioides coralli]|uniref:tRNA (adenosine(37)-N6)-threonylcarbamoyltransferase complex ATPase subunit type 1 TsaE n=1 Tax=Nocardioides coralli TaxID=2872154 RepID=UPI001CA43E51|nr:tRNA (adenosine(37)-N6)-threonylcarbamoyltransferase complex ATPase subunit type 1 TsaE [Nocardioides coralli]QZY28563.1 tRNA (adenosine(37)-N6)-threonylcarbamoyltransferase complex ATPase subunit type 1 TsaE [Nocardioides coralli]